MIFHQNLHDMGKYLGCNSKWESRIPVLSFRLSAPVCTWGQKWGGWKGALGETEQRDKNTYVVLFAQIYFF